MRVITFICLLGITLNAGATNSTPPVSIDYAKFANLVKPIVANMTLDEKLGQMTLAKFTFLQNNQQQVNFNLINQFHLGGILAAGGEVPNGQGGVTSGLDEPKDYLRSTVANWRKLNSQVIEHPVVIQFHDQAKVSIPLLLGVDGVHGNQTVLGQVLFPHNIGLSMTHNPELLKAVGYWTAHDVRASGFNWIYAPTVAISHNPDWGRYYESLGSVPQLTQKYAAALISGFQQNSSSGMIQGVLATAKHYLGDGATLDGVDEGNVKVSDFQRFFTVNSAGFQGALNSDVGSIMISYSAINNLPMSINKELNTQGLRNGQYFTKPFTGLIVSDYGAEDKVANQGFPTTTQKFPYKVALAKEINSGIDMLMISNASSYKTVANFLQILKEDVRSGAIPMTRIDDAVTHILAVKYAMGLIHLDEKNQWQSNPSPPVPNYRTITNNAPNAQAAEVKTATLAAEQSLVLLKNIHHLLPLPPSKIKYVVLIGQNLLQVRQDNGTYQPTLFTHYNNIGVQAGGWTASWQGIEGNDFWHGINKQTSGATSLLDALNKIAPTIKLIYPHYSSMSDTKIINGTQKRFLGALKTNYPDMNANNTVTIGVLAEPPYAEFMGDVASPYCKDDKNPNTGCLYNYHFNAYLPNQQRTSLAMNYDDFDQQIISALTAKAIPLISILFSGRPMIISQPTGPLEKSTAFIAAWLPGTSGGQAIANALFGNYLFCNGKRQTKTDLCQANSPNTLTVDWVQNMQSLQNYPIYNRGQGAVTYAKSLFEIGYGLAT